MSLHAGVCFGSGGSLYKCNVNLLPHHPSTQYFDVLSMEIKDNTEYTTLKGNHAIIPPAMAAGSRIVEVPILRENILMNKAMKLYAPLRVKGNRRRRL